MVWDHISITKPHLVYISLGAFTTLFMLCSSILKERLYLGEAIVATLFGTIFGPHAADLIDPRSWGSTDIITIEFARIVLVVQCFAVGLELPRFYMERHWRSILFLLLPVMAFGWLVIGLIIWWMIPPFSWLDSLLVASCVTITDPILASSIVGNGKFAHRVPKHLRDLLSVESGCNDAIAFIFMYLSLYLIKYDNKPGEFALKFFVYILLYECLLGAIMGFLIGYVARHGVKYAEKHGYIDRESFLVFYFVVALLCAGIGSILGLDDLLIGFFAGIAFSNDGWFKEKTEESHITNIIDLLLNLTFFVYFGTIIPWEQFNNGFEGIYVWRFIVMAILIFIFRRMPIILVLKPWIPDIRTWREALFFGYFGPVGVGAIFIAMLARGQLEHGRRVPLAVLPSPDSKEYTLIYLIWPIVAFIVVASTLVHGSSVAFFALGKHINTLNLTVTYDRSPSPPPKISAPVPHMEYLPDPWRDPRRGGRTPELLTMLEDSSSSSESDTASVSSQTVILKPLKTKRLPRENAVPPSPAGSSWTQTTDRFSMHNMRRVVNDYVSSEVGKRRDEKALRDGKPGRAYQFGNTVIVEDCNGDVLKVYDTSPVQTDNPSPFLKRFSTGLHQVGLGAYASPSKPNLPLDNSSLERGEPSQVIPPRRRSSLAHLVNPRKASIQHEERMHREAEDDKHIRFTVDGVGRRMNKADFIRQTQKLDADTRHAVVNESSASQHLKSIAKQQRPFDIDEGR